MSADTMEKCLRDEQVSRWYLLQTAIGNAMNGTWSIECGAHAQHIARIARLVGSSDPDCIPYPLVAGGVYAAVLDVARVAVAREYDEAEWQRVDDIMAAHSGRRETHQARFTPVVAAIYSPREAAWIAEPYDDDEGPS